MMNLLHLAWRRLWRDLRTGELTLLGVALIVAVASLSSVGFLTDRAASGLERDANQLLGGDLLLVSDRPWMDRFAAEARKLGLEVLETTLFTSMVSTGDGARLAAVKVVEPGYPLRGSLKIAAQPNMPPSEAHSVPQAGEVWLDERLASALQIKPGAKVSLGRSELRFTRYVMFESDRGSNFFSFVPRLILNARDLQSTGLIQPGSRIKYRLHIAGSREAVGRFQRWANARLSRGESIQGIGNARPEVRSNLDRAKRFLRLAAMLAVVLAAVAVGLASRRYMYKHSNGCAVMRCFGASRAQLLGMFAAEFSALGAVAALLGALLGFCVQAVLAGIAAELLNFDLPPPSLWPFLHGIAVGLVLMTGFVLPQLLQLSQVPPLHALRREWGMPQMGSLSAWMGGLGVLVGLMLWIADDLRLGAYAIGGFVAASAAFALIARGLLLMLARVAARLPAGSGWSVRYGLAALNRRWVSSLVQAVALSLGLCAILLLTFISGDLLDGWRGKQAADAPNRFVLNMQPDQLPAIRAFFAARLDPRAQPELLPMVRGRLVAINGEAVDLDRYKEGERARNLLEREFNLSWVTRLPESNTVVAGQWLKANAQDGFSVEEGLAKTLELHMGDRLRFEIGGQSVEANITSLRRLDWDSMRVNFFVIASPAMLDRYPASYITSFYLPPGQDALVNEMVANFPNLTLIDVGTLIAEIRQMTDKLAQLVQLVFGFALFSGAVVLYAALQATHTEREYELSVLRTMGARNWQLRAAMLSEFAVLGGVAAVLSVGGALGIAYLLARFVFDLPYQPSWGVFTLYGAMAACGVSLCAWLGVRGLLQRTVMSALRAAQA